MIIGISGTRCVGKDTACKLLNKFQNYARFAFADALKDDLKELVKSQFNIDIFNPSKEDKELIRPLMIAYGCMWREKDPDHWVKKVIDQIKPFELSVITDVRFENELNELERVYHSNFVHVNIVNEFAPKPTTEEQKHFQQIAQRAHYSIKWGNNTCQERIDIISDLYTFLKSRELEIKQSVAQ
jgi:hypothetical protein